MEKWADLPPIGEPWPSLRGFIDIEKQRVAARLAAQQHQMIADQQLIIALQQQQTMPPTDIKQLKKSYPPPHLSAFLVAQIEEAAAAIFRRKHVAWAKDGAMEYQAPVTMVGGSIGSMTSITGIGFEIAPVREIGYGMPQYFSSVAPRTMTLEITPDRLSVLLPHVWGVQEHQQHSLVRLLPYPKILCNAERQLHCETGPAVIWPHPEATNLFYLFGIRVPPETLDLSEQLSQEGRRKQCGTVKVALNHPNAEVRRVAARFYGLQKLMREYGNKISEDQYGVLWSINDVGAMVEVVNSTPEPDGSFRTYFLRVPDRMRTAHAAVAWTFGLEAKDYNPRVQT